VHDPAPVDRRGVQPLGTGATIDEIKREAIEMETVMGLRYQEPSSKWVRSASRGIAEDMIFTPQANRGDAAESLADEFGKPVKIGGCHNGGSSLTRPTSLPAHVYEDGRRSEFDYSPPFHRASGPACL